MRFEIVERDGLARNGRLEIDGSEYRTPTIAYADTWKHPAPSDGLKLRQSSLAKEGDLRVSPSGFSTSGDDSPCHLDVGFRGSPFADSGDSGCVAVLDDISRLMLDSRAFADAVDALKSGHGLLRPAFCSVLGLPHRLAFLSYCGIDILDSVPLVMAAESDQYLTHSGVFPLDALTELPCSCPACLAGIDDAAALLRHNIAVAENELRLVRGAISRGNLRELVEARIRTEPWQIQCLRLLDLEHHELQEMHAPVKGPGFMAGSKESLTRPEIARWRSRLRERYGRPRSAKILLLIPCSAKKPYSTSLSHRRFRAAIRDSGAGGSVHEVVVTSPLGIVPRELELLYPAQDYDIPVTGHWDRDEQHMVADLLTWLVESQGYDLVISHLGDERDVVNELLDDHIDTSKGRPGSRESLSELEDVLREHSADGGAVPRKQRTMEEMRSISMFQFGPAGEDICDGSTAEGRWPAIRIVRNGAQLGMLSPERGMISLTIDGAKAISRRDAYVVEIDDFVPKGNVFAVGVEGASPEIRIGDDVAVRNGDDVRAVGVARMSAAEIVMAERGEAVHVRHVSK